MSIRPRCQVSSWWGSDDIFFLISIFAAHLYTAINGSLHFRFPQVMGRMLINTGIYMLGPFEKIQWTGQQYTNQLQCVTMHTHCWKAVVMHREGLHHAKALGSNRRLEFHAPARISNTSLHASIIGDKTPFTLFIFDSHTSIQLSKSRFGPNNHSH